MQTTDTFFKNHGINPSSATKTHHEAVKFLVSIDEDYHQRTAATASRLSQDPAWGLTLRALDRIAEYASAAVCAAVSSTVGAEIIARTVLEASVNLMFILRGNRVERLYAYFHSYFETMSERSRKWTNAISGLPAADRAIHEAAILQKATALTGAKDIADRAFTEIGIVVATPPVWGNVFDRFDSIGGAVDYRTVYAALCSQTHNDAEDLVNEFVVRLSTLEGGLEKLRAETTAFSWFGVTLALDQYALAVICYLITFDLLTDPADAKALRAPVSKLVEDAAARLPSPSTT